MNVKQKNNLNLVLAVATTLMTTSLMPASQALAAIEGEWGKVYGDFILRYETVDQNNTLQEADALTLRSRLGYVSPTVNGLSATLEIEDVQAIVDDYSVPATGFQPGEYSVIADPESTEIDQAFVQYQSDAVQIKAGRQVMTLDKHRFVGHVGWRQDRQTFDALTAKFSFNENLAVTAAYINKRNRIFSDDKDIDSKDILLNAAYDLSVGKLTAYAYLLELDNGKENALDTYGIRFAGSKMVGEAKVLYHAEFASQKSKTVGNSFDADYLFLEAGAVFSGLTAKLGYEVLGSDDGAYAFSTPLATLHKFNGWADQFLGTPPSGLEDIYVSLGGKIVGGKWGLIYHDFSVDESAGANDLGDEVDLLYARKFAKRYSAGIKYATYSAGDVSLGKVDTDKLWFWVGAKF